jgi:hypothetical protein
MNTSKILRAVTLVFIVVTIGALLTTAYNIHRIHNLQEASEARRAQVHGIQMTGNLWIDAASEIMPPPPITTLWGDDYLAKYPQPQMTYGSANGIFMGKVEPLKHMRFVMLAGYNGPSYEFGLRSDGVVVWRELPPSK